MVCKDKTTIVKECYYGCPFFSTTMDGMECGHPFFDGKGYDSMIISHDNSHGRVPDECPLRKEEIAMKELVRLNEAAEFYDKKKN